MDIKKAREELRRGITIYDMPLRVAYYARVSTDKSDQLNSLENQQHYFEEMIKENKQWIFVDGYIDEGISGTAVKNRDSFLQMIEDSTQKKMDLILTKEISRFSRNTVDSIQYTEYLLEQGTIVYFLSDNLNTIQEDAEFRLTIMSSLAQDEVRKLSERVKFGIQRMIKDRKLIGGNLTGYYKKDGRYEINEEEEPIIRYLFETYASGTVSLKQISQELAYQNYFNSKGKPYSTTTLTKFLTNPRYKGFYTAHLSEVENYKTHKKRKVEKEKQIIERDSKIPAIVSEELWDKVNTIYETRKKHPARHNLNREEMLKFAKYSCKIYCKECGSIFIRAGGSNRSNQPTWFCKKYKTEGVGVCASPIIKESLLDSIFIFIFTNLLQNKKDYLKQIYQEYQAIRTYEDKEVIESQIFKLEKQKEKLLDFSMKEFISEEEFLKKNQKINQEISELIKQRKKYPRKSYNQESLKEKFIHKWNISKELPSLMKILINKITIEKIKGDRKKVHMIIEYRFLKEPTEISINLTNHTFFLEKECSSND